MAKVTSQSELLKNGFKLEDERSGDAAGGTGSIMATTRYYAKTRNATKSGIVRPITHHVFVTEYENSPGKYNVSYRVTQHGEPYSNGDFDQDINHIDNVHRNGSADPIRDVIVHHYGTMGAIDTDRTPKFRNVTLQNVHEIAPDRLGAGVSSDLRPYYNAMNDRPLDGDTYHKMTGGRGGMTRFAYRGRLSKEDQGTDVYHASYVDPRSRDTFEYSFTVRHTPSSEHPFSYNANRRQSGAEDNGDRDRGSFLDVTGRGDMVARFGTAEDLMSHHHRMLDALGIPRRVGPKKSSSDEFNDIIRGNKYSGTCSNCGKAVRDIPESSFRDDKLYQMTPEDDAPDPNMHGSPINLCGECYVDPDIHDMAHRMPKMFGWHHPGAKPGSCPDCDRSIMEEADEDLHP